jgi:hypothetical protein
MFSDAPSPLRLLDYYNRFYVNKSSRIAAALLCSLFNA